VLVPAGSLPAPGAIGDRPGTWWPPGLATLRRVMGFIDRLLGRTPEQAFAGEVTAVLHRTPGVRKVEPGRHDLELRVTRDGASSPDVMTLDNLFREVRGLGHIARRAQITRFVRVVTGELRVPGAWKQVSGRVLPVNAVSPQFVEAH